MGTFWKEFKQAGREMYGIPEGVSATRFVASLPKDYVTHVRGEAVSKAYAARRLKGLQAIMDFQHMGGATREHLEARRGGELPRNYHATKQAAHDALQEFPELNTWIDPNAIR